MTINFYVAVFVTLASKTWKVSFVTATSCLERVKQNEMKYVENMSIFCTVVGSLKFSPYTLCSEKNRVRRDYRVSQMLRNIWISRFMHIACT